MCSVVTAVPVVNDREARLGTATDHLTPDRGEETNRTSVTFITVFETIIALITVTQYELVTLA